MHVDQQQRMIMVFSCSTGQQLVWLSRVVVCSSHVDGVPTPPGKYWTFFLKIPGPGKSWKNILENYAFLLVLMENKQK